MKKYLLLLGAVFIAASVSAQEEKDLYNGGGVCYKLNPEDKTATASSFYRMHKGEYTNKDCYSGDIVIPATLDNGYTVTAIGDECFYSCLQLTSITMPNTIKIIGKYAFTNCHQLTSITIPASIEKIEDHGFHYCLGIETLTIEDSDTPLTIGNSSYTTGTVFYELRSLKTVYVGRNIESERPAFIDCTSITSMKFGEKVTSLQKYMCKNASSLEELTLSPSLKEIPEEAFHYCKALCNIAIGNNTNVIGDYAFASCSLPSINLENVKLTSIGKYAFSYNTKATFLILPETLTKIEDCCFHECRSIETLTIEDGDSPLTLGNSSYTTGTVFYELRGLKTVYVGRNIESERPAFIDCSSITSMKFGEKVTSLQKYMCKNASGLEELTLSPSLKEIPEEAFYYCKALRSIAIGNNTNVIGDNAFTMCNLHGINLEKVKLTSIGRYAFSANYNATFLKLPETLTSIGDNAFASCGALEKVTSNAVAPPTCGGKDVFSFVNTKDCKLIVPDASVEDYKSAFVWKDFFNIVSGVNDVQPEKDIITDYYTADGLHSSSARKGLNIIRTKDGQARKVVVR